MNSVLIAILSASGGALLGGVVRAMVASYIEFREANGVAVAIRAEVLSLIGLIARRKHAATLDALIASLEDPAHVVTPRDLLAVRVTQEYFAIFRALTPKLGSLGAASAEVVLFYNLAKAVVEDMTDLRERAERAERNELTLERDTAREWNRSLRDLLGQTVVVAEALDKKLERFAARRWIGLFR